MKLSEDLAWRGLIKDKTFTDESWLDTPQTFYHGVDASADSLTIGNLAALLLARRLMEGGWKAVLLVGGATSLIGDPGGKETERELQSREEIQKNAAAIKGQINNLFGGLQFTPVDNYDWFSEVKYLEFLREVGKHYSMTELMQRDFVSARMGELGSGISYAEFSYSLIQGYDYLQLFQKHGTVLQIGGSDQWGNMLSGVPLIRKKEGKEVHAMSMPLVVDKATGRKFGKSEAGAVWLDASRTSPTQFYQFWINAADEDVEQYLKIFTLLPKEHVEQVMNEHRGDTSQRQAQKRLAAEVTRLLHGEEAVGAAQNHAEWAAGVSSSPSAPPDGAESTYKFKDGVNVIDVIVQTGLASSNSEARRLKDEGGIYLNNKPLDKDILELPDLEGGWLTLRRGKKLQNTVAVELE